jgi:hypothetical protein
MLENLFLLYSNFPLTENPQNLTKIFKGINFNIFGSYKSILNKAIENITILSECNSPKSARKKLSKLKSNWFNSADYQSSESDEVKMVFNSAFEAVYGYLDDYCEDLCHWRKVREKVIGRKKLIGPKRLKCHECDQLFYINILNEIIHGKEYSQIVGFIDLLWDSNLCVNQTIEVITNKSKKPFKEDLQKSIQLWPHGFIENIDSWDDKGRFCEFIYGIVGYSLSEFLLDNDRRKLKLCQECNQFYISKTVRLSKYCSDKCRLAYHNRKRIQSGEAREYKRKKRMKGASESYYG